QAAAERHARIGAQRPGPRTEYVLDCGALRLEERQVLWTDLDSQFPLVLDPLDDLEHRAESGIAGHQSPTGKFGEDFRDDFCAALGQLRALTRERLLACCRHQRQSAQARSDTLQGLLPRLGPADFASALTRSFRSRLDVGSQMPRAGR